VQPTQNGLPNLVRPLIDGAGAALYGRAEPAPQMPLGNWYFPGPGVMSLFILAPITAESLLDLLNLVVPTVVFLESTCFSQAGVVASYSPGPTSAADVISSGGL